MAVDRDVVLGLARVRAPWFGVGGRTSVAGRTGAPLARRPSVSVAGEAAGLWVVVAGSPAGAEGSGG